MGIRSIFRTARFFLPVAIEMSRELWSRKGYEDSVYYSSFDDSWFDVMTESDADFFGVKWPGRPFIYIGQYHYGYDRLDQFLEWCSLLVYILSGEYGEDECRNADERLLSYAEG